MRIAVLIVGEVVADVAARVRGSGKRGGCYFERGNL